MERRKRKTAFFIYLFHISAASATGIYRFEVSDGGVRANRYVRRYTPGARGRCEWRLGEAFKILLAMFNFAGKNLVFKIWDNNV